MRKIYNETVWTSLLDFTISGFTPTLTGGQITFPTGAGTYTQFLTLFGLTNTDDNWRFSVTFKILTAVSTGLIIGRRTVNTTWPETVGAQLVLSTGQLRLDNNDSTNLVNFTEPALASNSVGDMIRLTMTMQSGVVGVRAENFTKNTSGSVEYKLGSGVSMPNTGDFYISNQNSAGQLEISSIDVESFTPDFDDVLVLGDSKVRYGASDYLTAYPSLLSSRLNTSVYSMSGNGDKAGDILAGLAYVKTLAPKKVLLHLGRNDIAFGTPLATWQDNYATIVRELQAVNIEVYHLLPVQENPALVQTALTSFLVSNYGAACINPSWNWNAATMVASDGVHPNDLGHAAIAATIVGSGKLL